MALAKDIARLSDGRAVYDARRRRLTLHDDAGAVAVDVEVGETELRNWLQRLLFTIPHEGGREPQEAAVLLLLARLEAARSAPATRMTLATLVG
ncbi:hypothetical protein [Nocardioides sp. W7]|uniref:hypothetical protein n=1 Tax=Nocardioides sp. W7 TaxID=2931390 RepID=UPI001FD1D635|nr:hypothetical protein [Nocardioides sp. W7]